MTAFRETSKLPVDEIEFDVHPTTDGQLVVHHDPTVDRMTNGSGAIASQSYADLAKLTINGTARDRIPLLSHVLELFRPTAIDLRLEIKADANRFRYKGLEPCIASALVDHRMERRTTVTSFAIDTLLSFEQSLPGVPMIWLMDRSVVRQIGDLGAVLQIAKSRGVKEIALHADDLIDKNVEITRALGLKLGAYAVNDEASIRYCSAIGLSVFTTNRPDLALKIKSKHHKGD
jgi:glycerophosphoryl diester phosphodiesterase